MSCLAAAHLLVGLAAGIAHAQALPSANPPATHAANGLEARHKVGIQVGGSSFFQVGYRFRAWGPLHLDIGGLGLPHGPINLSIGTVIALPVGNRWLPYVGVGAGHAGMEQIEKGAQGHTCDADAGGCSIKGEYVSYLYGRIGLGVAFGSTRNHLVALDIGTWYGTLSTRSTDAAGVETSSTKRVLWPMPGLSYFLAL